MTFSPFLQILHEVDTILFSLLILRGLNDSQGRVWRCHPSQLYAVEVTLPKKGPPSEVIAILPESRTLALLEMLPTITCVSPAETLDHLPMKNIGECACKNDENPCSEKVTYVLGCMKGFQFKHYKKTLGGLEYKNNARLQDFIKARLWFFPVIPMLPPPLHSLFFGTNVCSVITYRNLRYFHGCLQKLNLDTAKAIFHMDLYNHHLNNKIYTP